MFRVLVALIFLLVCPTSSTADTRNAVGIAPTRSAPSKFSAYCLNYDCDEVWYGLNYDAYFTRGSGWKHLMIRALDYSIDVAYAVITCGEKADVVIYRTSHVRLHVDGELVSGNGSCLEADGSDVQCWSINAMFDNECGCWATSRDYSACSEYSPLGMCENFPSGRCSWYRMCGQRNQSCFENNCCSGLECNGWPPRCGHTNL